MMKKHLLSISLIIISGLFVYGATLQSPYHWDDYRTIVDNPALADPFQLHNVFAFWPTRVFLFWTFSLNQASGSSALFTYHLTNIAIHLTAAIVLYLLIYRTLSTAIPAFVGAASSRDHIAGQSRLEAAPTVCRPIPVGEICHRFGVMPDNPERQKEYAWIAVIAALLFVAHPISTGAVTYLIQRGVSLSAALGLLSLLFYTYARGLFFSAGRSFISPRHLLLYGLSLISLLLAMMSKEGAVVFPILIICWELVFGEKTQKHSANNDTGALPAKVRSAGLQPCQTKAGLKSRTTSNHRTGYRMFTKRLPLRSRFLYLFPLVLTIAIIPILALTTSKSAGLQDDILYRINSPLRPVSVTFIDGGEGSYLANSWEYFLTQLKSIAIYIRLAFLPGRQNFYYHLMPRHSLFQGRTIFLLMGYLTIIISGIKLVFRVSLKERTVGEDVRTVGEVSRRSGSMTGNLDPGGQAIGVVRPSAGSTRNPSHEAGIPAVISRRLIGAGILWFFIALIPTSSFLILWPFLSEFHLYISLAGLSFFWAGLIMLPRNAGIRKVFRSLLLLSVLAFALLAFRRNAVYSSAISLWEDTAQKSPRLAPAHSNLSAAYIGSGNYEKAIEEAALAMDLNSKFNSYRNLRTAYRALGKMEKADELIEEEMERFPESYRGYYEKALTIINNDPEGAHQFLIKALEKNPPPEIRAKIEVILVRLGGEFNK